MQRPPQQIRAFFEGSAPDYEAKIVPAFRQFAAAVLATAQPQGNEVALDIGTGTGILARLLATKVRQVLAVDFAARLLREALPHASPNSHFVLADAHHLPFPAQSFDLACASFGLNATQPRRVFAAIGRVLKPGGLLAFHEWSIQHPLDSAISDILAQYMLPDEEVSEALFALREFTRSLRPWDNLLQDVEDFHELLGAAGFRDLQVWEDRPVTCTLPYPDFLAYKLAWTGRQAELAAMDPWQRGDCLDALRALLQDEADAAGNVNYAPLLFRVRARR